MKSLEPAPNKSKKKQCIVHYAGLAPYSELKDVNEEKKARIRAAKAKQQALKGRNHHEEQIYLYLITDKMPKRSSDGNSTWVYPEVSFFCKKGHVSYRGKKMGLAKLEMKEAELLIK